MGKSLVSYFRHDTDWNGAVAWPFLTQVKQPKDVSVINEWTSNKCGYDVCLFEFSTPVGSCDKNAAYLRFQEHLCRQAINMYNRVWTRPKA